jgi:alpha-galactosidase
MRIFRFIVLATMVVILLCCGPSVNRNENNLSAEAVAETPPMGWNSYNCYGSAVTEQEVRDNARMMAVHLKKYGWQYIVVDYCWFYPYPGTMNNPPQTREFNPPLTMDNNGRLLPSTERFPSCTGEAGFKPLADYVHSLGLKFGIHVMRGVPREAVAKKLRIADTDISADMIAGKNDTCGWLNSMYGIDMSKPGAQEYYNSIFRLYASWGVDFVKVDDIATPYHAPEIEAVRKAIENSGRNMVLSLSPGDDMPAAQADHAKKYANMWRISADFWDNWESLKKQFELCNKWSAYSGPGHWPDADMLTIGRLNRRGPNPGMERMTNFTADEQKTLLTLWCIFRSPLMIGGDLILSDNYTLTLLTNGEVLSVDQQSLNNRQLFREGDKIAWIADIPQQNDKYLAFFNTSAADSTEIRVNFQDLGMKGTCKIRDLWNHRDLGGPTGSFASVIPPHGAGLYKITPDM